jgi:3-hydroxyacyl-CoA dehydrogenase
MRQAVADADFVQENGPERPELKVKLFAEIDDATRRKRSSRRAHRASR